MGGPTVKVRVPETREQLAARRALVLAEVEAKRAAGVAVHGCDFENESMDTEEGPAEFTREHLAWAARVAKETTDRLRAEAGGWLFGDPMSAWERHCRLRWAVGVAQGSIGADEPFVLAEKPEGWMPES
jgi:hypothetical protein